MKTLLVSLALIASLPLALTASAGAPGLDCWPNCAPAPGDVPGSCWPDCLPAMPEPQGCVPDCLLP
jgi:hypothetical protein